MVPDIQKRAEIKKGIELDYSEESLQALNEWFDRELKIASKEFSIKSDYYWEQENHANWVPSLWKSIATDCAIYCTEILMRRCISLEWYFDKKAPKKCDDRYYPAIK
jgi:hypothetical protein